MTKGIRWKSALVFGTARPAGRSFDPINLRKLQRSFAVSKTQHDASHIFRGLRHAVLSLTSFFQASLFSKLLQLSGAKRIKLRIIVPDSFSAIDNHTMAALDPQVNGGIVQDPAAAISAPIVAKETPAQAPQRKRPQRPNYALIHAKPLPLDVYPLPAFIPQNPLSLLRIATVILRQFFSPPSSHSATPCIGYFSAETRSVHVTDPVHIRALWEMGFFGKGTLSRSEPSWLEREKARLKASGSGGTSEENTRKRREERRLFKLERARLEAEQIEDQLRQEKKALLENAEKQAVIAPSNPRDSALSHVFPWIQDPVSLEAAKTTSPQATGPIEQPVKTETATPPTSKKVEFTDPEVQDLQPPPQKREPLPDPEVTTNQEHLQLTLEEAFYLSYGLGALQIHHGLSLSEIPVPHLFTLSRTHSHFPPCSPTNLSPADPFLLNYAVYHYYRSLGWVVRPGVKFSVDYLLYNRGPVFSHAEFGLIIIPEFTQGTPEAEQSRQKDWWWLHCINRVQSQVKKSLVICYVRVPRETVVGSDGQVDVGRTLAQYEVREFVVRRWLANRSRD